MQIKVGMGQDSHRFDEGNNDKQLVLGGVVFQGETALRGNSDADVVLHAITNAITSVTGRNVIGKVSDEMCQQGITDSREYLKEALNDITDYVISHVAVCIEGQRPKISPKVDDMKASIAGLLGIATGDVGITATTGEDLTAFGRGEGMQSLVTITMMKRI